MTLTFDGEQAFWWAASLGIAAVAFSALADTGLRLVRLAHDLERDHRFRPRTDYLNRRPR